MICLGTPSLEMAKQEFRSVLSVQPSQLWSLNFGFQRAGVFTEKFLQGVTVTMLVVKAGVVGILWRDQVLKIKWRLEACDQFGDDHIHQVG